jgi:hypothetical protein
MLHWISSIENYLHMLASPPGTGYPLPFPFWFLHTCSNNASIHSRDCAAEALFSGGIHLKTLKAYTPLRVSIQGRSELTGDIINYFPGRSGSLPIVEYFGYMPLGPSLSFVNWPRLVWYCRSDLAELLIL